MPLTGCSMLIRAALELARGTVTVGCGVKVASAVGVGRAVGVSRRGVEVVVGTDGGVALGDRADVGSTVGETTASPVADGEARLFGSTSVTRVLAAVMSTGIGGCGARWHPVTKTWMISSTMSPRRLNM
jgi:hypothetical protein